jgi:quercetin dioxygenase-like cupin family protein
MKKTSLIAVGMAAMVLAGARGQDSASTGAQGAAAYATANTAAFQEKFPGVSMATVWGDPETGAHGTLTKFAPGYDAGMHTHTNDLTVAVIKGAYVYRDDAGEKRVGPGEVIHIPGGHKHWSGGDKTEGALFYEEGCGKFDKVDVK